MKASPILVRKDASGESLRPIGDRETVYDEAWLQELLRRHPEVLPVAEIEPVFHPLIPIGREVGTETGAIDNLFISPRGYVVLVETKLWRNPQAKREVVGQAIDYGSALSKWSYSRLDEAVKAYVENYEKADLDLMGWVEENHGPVEGGQVYFEETVAKNLRLGRFLTLIVGDRIRRSVIEMLNYVNKYPNLANDVALVELSCYRWKRDSDWPLLVVPSVVARTEIIERSVIQVTVKQDGTHQVDVRQEKAEKEDKGRKRVTLTEEAFWELLMEQAPECYEDIRHIIEEFRATDGITIDPTTAGVAARFQVPDTSEQVTVFFVYTSGELCVWPDTLRNQLSRAGIDPELVRRYSDRTRSILKMPRNRKEFSRSVAELDLKELISAVHEFIEEVQREAANR
jgi:hypothetical protein